MADTRPFLITNKPLRVSYEVPEQVADFLKKGDISYGAETDNFAVEIKLHRFDEYAEEYLSSPMFAAKELANDMEVATIREGDSWELGRGNAAYIVCEDSFDEDVHPHTLVFLIIFDPRYQVVYEVTVDCYEITEQQGISIVKSFILLD